VPEAGKPCQLPGLIRYARFPLEKFNPGTIFRSHGVNRAGKQETDKTA
jgi:hypothetical protein